MLAASHLDFLRLFPHLPVSGAPASDLGSLDMALMYSHDDRPHRRASANVLSITGITRRLRATFKLIHRQIAAATGRARRAPWNGGRQLSATSAVSR
jgi:hypothetical protein